MVVTPTYSGNCDEDGFPKAEKDLDGMATNPEDQVVGRDYKQEQRAAIRKTAEDIHRESPEMIQEAADAMEQWEEATPNYPSVDHIKQFRERSERIRDYLVTLYPDGMSCDDYVHAISLIRMFNQLISEGNEA